MARFLLEIGTEELPARFLDTEEADLQNLFVKELAEADISHGDISVLATPRRLAIIIEDLAEKQPVKEELVMGPPVKAAYDANGKPTRALDGFAKTNNLPPESIITVKTAKGEYAAAKRLVGGRTTLEILSEICPRIIENLPFAKRMKWGANEFAYARPLRWIVALLDSTPVIFHVGPVASANKTWGHRVHGSGPFSIDNVNDYEMVLGEKCAIIPDPQKRKQLIVENGDRLAREKNGEIIWKDSLLNEVCGLVEHPVVLLGSFDPDYLEIPAEVLLTSMETHQKSFGVKDSAGELLPHFLTVLNLSSRDIEKVRQGWEKVLKARLEDAHFFWKSDLKQHFDEWLRKLDSVIFIGPLGNMGEKSRRLSALCGWLASRINPNLIQAAERAGALAKADLVSGMVGEFDVLQGIMGGIYAERHGENKEVAEAIKEQYLPAGPDSPLPGSLVGAILSIADKGDTLAGCFGLNMIPTGAADPNGLRRCALGIIRILLDRNIPIDIAEFFDEARGLYGERKWRLDRKNSLEKLLVFFTGRLRNYFITQGYDAIFVDSVLASGLTTVTDFKARLDALTAFAKKTDFIDSLQTLKRVENISKKSSSLLSAKTWDRQLLEEEAEKELGASLEEILPQLDELLARGNYDMLLQKLTELRYPVDKFFDNVMVLCENEKIRANRLKMLGEITARFAPVAQFNLLQI